MNALDLFSDAVAGYRITRLVTADVITEPIRDRIIRHAYRVADLHSDPIDHSGTGDQFWDSIADDYGPHDRAEGETLTDATARDQDAPKLATLVTCRWCAGVWVAAGVVGARLVAPRVWSQIARGGVVATAAVLVAGLED